jgi:hypothetical protein
MHGQNAHVMPMPQQLPACFAETPLHFFEVIANGGMAAVRCALVNAN